jgi:hypothetical protein
MFDITYDDTTGKNQIFYRWWQYDGNLHPLVVYNLLCVALKNVFYLGFKNIKFFQFLMVVITKIKFNKGHLRHFETAFCLSLALLVQQIF